MGMGPNPANLAPMSKDLVFKYTQYVEQKVSCSNRSAY